MDDKLRYIPNVDKQNYHFSSLKLFVEKFRYFYYINYGKFLIHNLAIKLGYEWNLQFTDLFLHENPPLLGPLAMLYYNSRVIDARI